MSFDAEYFRRYYQTEAMRSYVVDEAAHLLSGISSLIAFMNAPLDSVLDVGAGTGRVRDWFRAHRPEVRVRSTDVSEHACATWGHEQRDITRWRDPEESFDLVVCNGVLAYLDDEPCAAAVGNLAAMTRGFLYLNLVTQEDITRSAVDFANTDLDGIHRRPVGFYLELLAPFYIRLGLGLFYRRGGPLALAALERCD